MSRDCDECGGEGVVDVDHFTPGRGHFTTSKPCPRCYGTAREQLELALDDDSPRVIDLEAAVRATIERERT